MDADEEQGGSAERRCHLRLLAIAPAFDQSSYSRVVHSTLKNLGACEVQHLAINHRGPVVRTPWLIHPNPRIGDRYGIIEAMTLAKAFVPDVIFIFNSL